MSNRSFGEKLIRWGMDDPAVDAMIIVGSRANSTANGGLADEWSDWDFQIVTTVPQRFTTADWVDEVGLSKPVAYVNRPGRLGHTAKITAVFPEGDLDMVLIPSRRLLLLSCLIATGLIDRIPRARLAMRDLALVWHAGHRVVKCAQRWKGLFSKVQKYAPPSISDKEIYNIAEGYVCDFLSTHSKLHRGEYLAAQRWLHVSLAEVNFRLLHELNLRLGASSFPDARRIESTASAKWRKALTIDASPDYESLTKALRKNAECFRELMFGLVGTKWTWPDLSFRSL